jgi:hypothetical protein
VLEPLARGLEDGIDLRGHSSSMRLSGCVGLSTALYCRRATSSAIGVVIH